MILVQGLWLLMTSCGHFPAEDAQVLYLSMGCKVKFMVVSRTFSADAICLKMSEFCAETHKPCFCKWSYIIRAWTCIIISTCN